jgi:hypothetical protein
MLLWHCQLSKKKQQRRIQNVIPAYPTMGPKVSKQYIRLLNPRGQGPRDEELPSSVSNQRSGHESNYGYAVALSEQQTCGKNGFCRWSNPEEKKRLGTKCKNGMALYSHGEGAWGSRHSS